LGIASIIAGTPAFDCFNFFLLAIGSGGIQLIFS
jgi:hypothetical protein